MNQRFLLLSTFIIPFSIVTYYLIQNLGVFKKLQEKNVDKCIHEFPNIDQPEHVQVYKNILLLSSCDRNRIISKFWNLNETEYNSLNFETSGIYALYPPFNSLEDIKSKIPEKVQLINYPKHQKFLPLAFSFYEDVLFVINTSYDGDKIDIFDIIQQNDTLKIQLLYKRSMLFGKNFSKSLNSIYAISQDEFLVTKFSPLGHFESWSTIKTFIAQLTKQNVTYTMYCKIGKQSLNCDILHNTASTLNNGVVKDQNNRIYIAHTIQEKVSVYDLEEYQTEQGDSRKRLNWLRDIKVPGGPDNLNYDKEKQVIYVAMVNRFYDFIKSIVCLSMNDWKVPDQEDMNFWGSAGQINVEGEIHEMEYNEIFTMNNKIRAISGMERIGNHYFLGSFIDNKLLVCEA